MDLQALAQPALRRAWPKWGEWFGDLPHFRRRTQGPVRFAGLRSHSLQTHVI